MVAAALPTPGDGGARAHPVDEDIERPHYEYRSPTPIGTYGILPPPPPRDPRVGDEGDFIRLVAAQVSEYLQPGEARQGRPNPIRPTQTPPWSASPSNPRESGYTSFASTAPPPTNAFHGARGGPAATATPGTPYQLRAPFTQIDPNNPSRSTDRSWIELEKLPAPLWVGPSPARNEGELGRKWSVRDCAFCRSQGRPEVNPETGYSTTAITPGFAHI